MEDSWTIGWRRDAAETVADFQQRQVGFGLGAEATGSRCDRASTAPWAGGVPVGVIGGLPFGVPLSELFHHATLDSSRGPIASRNAQA